MSVFILFVNAGVLLEDAFSLSVSLKHSGIHDNKIYVRFSFSWAHDWISDSLFVICNLFQFNQRFAKSKKPYGLWPTAVSGSGTRHQVQHCCVNGIPYNSHKILLLILELLWKASKVINLNTRQKSGLNVKIAKFVSIFYQK